MGGPLDFYHLYPDFFQVFWVSLILRNNTKLFEKLITLSNFELCSPKIARWIIGKNPRFHGKYDFQWLLPYLIRTIRVSGTKFLLTSNFVIFWVTKIAIRTSTDRTVRTGFTNSISTADNRSSTNILTFSLSKTKKRKRILNLVFELVWSVFKFTYSDKATNLCEISTVYLSYVVMVKSKVEIS